MLLGGLAVLNANFGGAKLGVFTSRPESLTNDFFTNLLDMGTEWRKSSQGEHVYEGYDRKSGAVKWTGSAVDLPVRFELPTPSHRGVLRVQRLAASVRPRLRGSLEQGDESRSVRSGCLISIDV